MEENKIDFDKYLERLEGYEENFEEKITSNNAKIEELNQESEKARGAIAAYRSYYDREMTKTPENKKELQKKLKTYHEEVMKNERTIMDLEEKNKALAKQQEKKDHIIEGIIKDATNEFNNYEKTRREELKTEKEEKNLQNQTRIQELKDKIKLMDEIGNKSNREAQEKVQKEIENIEAENSKLPEKYDKMLNKEINKNKIEFKRKINREYLSKRAEEIKKEKDEAIRKEEKKADEEVKIKKEDERRIQQSYAEHGGPEEFKAYSPVKPEQTQTQQTQPTQTQTQQTQPTQAQTQQTQPTQAQTQQTQPTQTQTQQTQPTQTQTQPTQQTRGNHGPDLEIQVNAQKNEAILNFLGKEVKKNEAILDKEEIKSLYKRININNIIKETTESRNIFKNLSIKRKLDPSIVKLLQDEDKRYLLEDYILSVESREKLEKIDRINYNLKDADKEDVIAISKYAKHAKEFAEIEGELAKGPIGRTINGIKGLFGKVKKLSSATKMKLLGDGTLDREKLPKDIKNNMEYMSQKLQEEQDKIDVDSIIHTADRKMNKYVVEKGVKDKCDQISWNYSKNVKAQIKEESENAKNANDGPEIDD